jgi:lactase-phlorizin hydrolase
VNIWDTFTHQANSPIADRSTGDVACDSYHRFHEDVIALKNMGANFYRFSLSWSRILPNGDLSEVNRAGIDYYNRLIDDLIANGIEPYVTLYHWDLPQPLMDQGGWLVEQTALHFADYARVAFEHFGDRVKTWITFNEVNIFCNLGYNYGSHAPGIREPVDAPYQCVHNVIKGHGLAYRIYDGEYRAAQQGKVGITLDSNWNEPLDRNNASDVAASHRALKFGHGWIANPLFRGEYPPIMRKMVDEKSAAEGRQESRLPTFNPTWTNVINGTLDFLGLNHYSTNYGFATSGGAPGHDGDADTGSSIDPTWPESGTSWLRVVPWGFRRLLNWLAMEYGNPPIYVTENGYADKDTDGVADLGRIDYYRKYINEMLKAVRIDGVNVKGYTAWSLIDNFEWAQGYTERFGVHYIDFAGGNLTRVPKASARFLTQVIKDNGFPPSGQ